MIAYAVCAWIPLTPPAVFVVCCRGHKPPPRAAAKAPALTQQEIAEACARGGTSDETSVFDKDRVTGIGFGSCVFGGRHR